MESQLGIEGSLSGKVVKTGAISRLLNKVRRTKELTDHRPTAKEILNATR